MKEPIYKKTNMEIETEIWNGESLEEKVRRVVNSNEAVEAIAPMIYTERKEGVKPEYDIRSDKWEIAQKAMNTIAEGHREKRKQRIEQQNDGGPVSAVVQ